MPTLTLNDIAPGARCVIVRLEEEGPMRRRLLDMGFTQGALAECELIGPSGDPRAYRVRGALVALRRENARNIFVEG